MRVLLSIAALVLVIASAHPGAAYWDAGQTLAPLLLDLPDPGPRLDEALDTSKAPAFPRALEAFHQKRIKAAQKGFRAALTQAQTGPVADAARAHLAELLLADPAPQRRLQAIDLYRELAMQSPGSPNAARALWRQGDLYVELRMFVEAKAVYERAAGSTDSAWDRERALLGLGYGYVRWGRWGDALHVFQTIRRTDGPFARWANLALADTLYVLKEFPDARASYETVHRLWPDLFNDHPVLLIKYADTLWLDRQTVAARRLYVDLYNVHPRRPEAGVALIRVGDTLRHAGLWGRASLFYADALSKFADSPTAAVARMRLAQLGQQMLRAADHRPGGIIGIAWQPVSVGSLDAVLPPLDEATQRHAFEDVVARYDESIIGSEARFHLGELYEGRHDDLEAARIYDELVQRGDRIADDPWPDRALQRLAVVMTPWIQRALRRGDDLTAVALYRESRGRAQDALAASALLLPLADAHRRFGDSAEAVKLYQEVLRDRNSAFHEEAVIGLAWSYLAQDDLGAAKRMFERYRLQHPSGRWTSEAVRALAMVQDKLEDRPAAIRMYRHWLHVFPSAGHPDRGPVLVALAKLLAETGEISEALRLYDQADRTEAGQDPDVLVRRADLLAGLNRFEPAAQLYARATAVAKDSELADWAGLQLGRMRRLQKRYADAGTALDQLAERTSDDLIGRLSVAMKKDLPEEE